MLANLVQPATLQPDMLQRIVKAAAGNSLYAEQMLSMLIDNGALRLLDGCWVRADETVEITVPPTIHALLEARLDKLARAERASLEPASVIGLEFVQSALASLAPEAVRAALSSHLGALAHKQFIHPKPAAGADPQFRFHNHLVRETVYNGLLKRARANLHLEFVRWADRVNAGNDRGMEYEEILGWHLEQAWRYLGELGPLGVAGVEIGADAAKRLSSAGRRALARGDMHAAASLLRRAVALLDAENPARWALLPELAEAQIGVADFAAARAVLDEAAAAASNAWDLRLEGAAKLLRMLLALYSGEQRHDWGETTLRDCHALIPQLERENAHNELATAWRLVLLVHGIAGRFSLASEAVVRSTAYARLAGNDRLVARNGLNLALNVLHGPMPVPQAIAECEALIAAGLGDRQVECNVICALAQLKAMNGELEAGRALYHSARAQLRDLGQGVYAASTAADLARVELRGGNLALAEQEVRADCGFLDATGETYFLSTLWALLALIVRGQGRDDEALELTQRAEAATAVDDTWSQALWRMARAPILARKGELELALELARQAVELVQGTESPMLKGEAQAELAAVLALAGNTNAARETAAMAIGHFRSKQNRVAVAAYTAWADILPTG
jgi:tetratricopeptide (TPR) repeat protein